MDSCVSGALSLEQLQVRKVNFDCNCLLDYVHAQHDPGGGSMPNQYFFGTAEWPMLNSNLLSNLQERMRHAIEFSKTPL